MTRQLDLYLVIDFAANKGNEAVAWETGLPITELSIPPVKSTAADSEVVTKWCRLNAQLQTKWQSLVLISWEGEISFLSPVLCVTRAQRENPPPKGKEAPGLAFWAVFACWPLLNHCSGCSKTDSVISWSKGGPPIRDSQSSAPFRLGFKSPSFQMENHVFTGSCQNKYFLVTSQRLSYFVCTSCHQDRQGNHSARRNTRGFHLKWHMCYVYSGL